MTDPVRSHAKPDQQVDVRRSADPGFGERIQSISENLLDQVRRTQPSLCAEDAFLVPPWFCDQRSWVQYPWDSNSAVYNLPLFLHIRGILNREALTSALKEIQFCHQVLRSVFRIIDDQLIQIVQPPRPIAVPLADLSDMRGTEAELQAKKLAREEAGRPFDFVRQPGLRVRLVQLAPDEHILLLTTHHLVCDDWSTGILFREMFSLYQAFAAGNSNQLPQIGTFQYGDFIRWQQKQLQGKALESRLSFWKEQLAGGSDFHHLEPDHPRPAQRTYRGGVEKETLPEYLVSSLKILSQQEKVSLFMIMLAVFQCLLHEYSSHEDIAVGCCAANRPLVEVEGVIGRFANDLVLRTDLTGNPTFRELLARVRKTSLTAFSYQDLPFGKLVDELQPRQTLGRNPLFQSMFIFQDAPKASCEVPGLILSPFALELGTAKYDLNVWLRPQKGLEIVVEYNTDLFEPATMARMLDRYQRLLEATTKHPDVRISQLLLPKLAKEIAPRFHENRQDFERTHDNVGAKLIEIWERMLGQRPIGLTDDYFQLGGTSLQAVQLFTEIEKVFGVKLPLATLVRASTIKELSEAVRKSGAAGSSACLVEIQPGGRRPAFFFVHGASGNVFISRNLARQLGPNQPFYGVQPQGLDGKRPLFMRVEDMAARYLEEIQCLQPKGPYFFGGYCGGGTIAFEMAQQLYAQGQKVALLALFECYNWAKMEPDSLPDDIYFYLQRTLFRCGNFFLMNSKDKLRCLQRKLKRFRISRCISIENIRSRLVLSEMGELLALVDTVLKKHRNRQLPPAIQEFDFNTRAVVNYVPKVYPGRIFHFRSMNRFARYGRPGMDWDGLAAEGVETFVLPVYPGKMFSEPFVRNLAAKLRMCIETFSGH